ncbi:MAG: apolipoprotein N-acyltransferase [Oligoflexia bacterium]|nr:apolipoprotein N-acyltransferase [Oligoflexia bacterium]
MIHNFLESRFFVFLLPILAGVLYSFGFPTHLPFKSFFFPSIGIAVLLLNFDFNYSSLLNDREKKSILIKEFLSILIFLVVINFLGFYWLAFTFTEFGDIPFPLNYLLSTFFSLIVMPQYWLFWIILIIWRNLKQTFTLNFKINRSVCNLIWAFVFTICEYSVPNQFPAFIGHPYLQLAPYLGLAPVAGAEVYSFMGFLLAMFIYRLIKDKELEFPSLIFYAIFLLINILCPLKNTFHFEDKVNNIRIVQPNVGNFLKISSERGAVDSLQEILSRYTKLSTDASNIKRAEELITVPFVAKDNSKRSVLDLIIWPETAYPFKLNVLKMKDANQVPAIFTNIMKTTGAQIFFGGYTDRDKELLASEEDFFNYFERTYNSAFLLTEKSGLYDVYHKNMLIPFGETLPFWSSLNRFISRYVPNISFFARGERPVLFKTRNDTYFTTAICYELLFSNFISDLLNKSASTNASANDNHKKNKLHEPHFLINLTNDSWYGDTMEPHQHLFLGKWRALEFDLPIVRSTNTGISLVIYPDGSESPRIATGETKFLDLKLITSDRKPTFYQKYGKGALFMVFALLVILSLVPFRSIIRSLFFKKKTLFKKAM